LNITFNVLAQTLTLRMDNSNFDGNILTVTSFFGALTFTVMVLLIQFSDEIQFSEIIIPWMGLVSFFFIINSIGILNADSVTKPDRMRKLMKVCFVLGFYGLVLVIPALIYSFDPIIALVVFIVEIIVIGIYNSTIK